MTSPKFAARSTKSGEMARANIRVKACWLKITLVQSMILFYHRPLFDFSIVRAVSPPADFANQARGPGRPARRRL